MIACARLKRHCQAARAIDHRPFGSRVPQTRDGPALRCQSVALFRASVWRSWVAQALLPVRVLLPLSSMHSQEWLCYSTLSATHSAVTSMGPLPGALTTDASGAEALSSLLLDVGAKPPTHKPRPLEPTDQQTRIFDSFTPLVTRVPKPVSTEFAEVRRSCVRFRRVASFR